LQVAEVISLDPRTPHQPEKLQKLSKNNCVLLLLFFRSIAKTKFYVLWIQSSAAHSQGCAAGVVQEGRQKFKTERVKSHFLAVFVQLLPVIAGICRSLACENREKYP
jgi:hypothetical protein